MVIKTFAFSRIPKIHFGNGNINILDLIISGYGNTVLIVTGASSFESTGKTDAIGKALKKKSVTPYYLKVTGEPSPELIDEAVTRYKDYSIDVVCAIGGGSVVDTGKAVSAMLPGGGSVFDYLEGVGTGKKHDGAKIPFIAVPTTAGTGSEATKNAVLSNIGSDGYKKSLRHDNFVPDIAVIDPELMLSCPQHVTSSTGMDAMTQLMEAYVSTKASPLTDAVAYSGLGYAVDNLIPACTSGAGNIEVRAGMAYAALLSGITLANAGLGTVHGLASVIGGMFDIPHGVVCGTIMGAAVRVTIDRLRQEKDDLRGLKKYADIGRLISKSKDADINRSCDMLIMKLAEWTEMLQIPRLSAYGITETHIDSIVKKTDNKNNPVDLDRDDIRRIIVSRL
ncbi:iron-containing alcohol dehydrogenase [Candidatus Latescibacterota bacterium]